MTTITVPADQAEMLLRRRIFSCSERWAAPAKDIVIHGQEVKPVECERCLGSGGDPESCEALIIGAPEVPTKVCPLCRGTGTVPAVVTLAVECDHTTCGEPRRSEGMEWTCDHWATDGHSVVGSATVAECLPIAQDFGLGCVGRHVEIQNEEVLLLGVQETAFRDYSTVVTDRCIGSPEPGLWALILTDVVTS